MNRESIAAAIFARLQTVDGLNKTSRVQPGWDEVSSMDQPAAFLSYLKDRTTPRRGLPAEHEIDYSIIIYVRADEPDAIPQQALNGILDEVDVAFLPDAGSPQLTLGVSGVSRIWIEGETAIYEGILSKQSVAVIPLKVLAM